MDQGYPTPTPLRRPTCGVTVGWAPTAAVRDNYRKRVFLDVIARVHDYRASARSIGIGVLGGVGESFIYGKDHVAVSLLAEHEMPLQPTGELATAVCCAGPIRSDTGQAEPQPTRCFER